MRKSSRKAEPAAVCTRGFTLLELLISLTITAVIVVLVFGAFRIGVRAWEKGEADIAYYQRLRAVLELLHRQMASIEIRRVDSETSPYAVVGEADWLHFVSRTPVVPTNPYGLVYVQYRVEEGDEGLELQLYEKNLALAENAEALIEPDELHSHVLLSGMAQIAFDYLGEKSAGEESAWEERWEGQKTRAFPRAVRLRVKPGEDSPPLTVIARLVPVGVKEMTRVGAP